MIQISGSEGGGQLLRTALSLSAITGKAFRIYDIRGKREKAGLKRQHLTAVNAVAKICNANAKGAVLESKELEFYPRGIRGGRYKFDIGSAGSTTLVLQTILPVLLFGKRESFVAITGGTANPLAPPAFELGEVFLDLLRKVGIEAKLDIVREGFYPKGQGSITAYIRPCAGIKPLYLTERGRLEKISVYAVASRALEKADVAERLIKGFRQDLNLNCKAVCYRNYVDSASVGCYITAIAEFENTRIGYTQLGEIGKLAEDVGKECLEGLLKEIDSGACLDKHCADQILIYIALAKKGAVLTSGITGHIRTNIKVIEQFLDVKFGIEGNLVRI